MHKRLNVDETIKCSSFATSEGAEECYMTITTNEATSFSRALGILKEKYQSALKHLDLSEETLAFCRLYLSDIENQKDQLAESEFFNDLRHGAVSIIQQNPLTHDAIIVFAYHLKKAKGEYCRQVLNHGSEVWRSGVKIQGEHYSMVWNSNLTGPGILDSKQQTATLFQSFSDFLHQHNLNVRNNLIRTWMYVRDIDNHYTGMVEARRDFFLAQGLSPRTRFVASTGIEGKAAETRAIVAMDSVSYGNISEEQISTMNALDQLSPTIVYGVTFERGLRLRFGDRSHLYISGTASIDKDGKILHEGSVENQTHRTVDNVQALLANQQATLADLAYVLCYIRNPKHYECVNEIIKARLPQNIPMVIVEGAVCRPGWLFEMEGIGIVAEDNPFPPFM